MSCVKNEIAMCELTQDYWENHRGDLDWYIANLLGRELTFAQSNKTPDKKDRLRRLRKDSVETPVHTLALTVGQTFEPLLQVVCVLKPKRLVLILNSQYSGRDGNAQGVRLERLVHQLPTAPCLPDDCRPGDIKVIHAILESDTPTMVFKKLREKMQKEKAQPPAGWVNAVDITGAKKSMVAGAFLYAAHSGLPITYVDFDKYDTTYGPYGYQCRIGQITNPYQAYHLRDWDRVRELYQRYDFRGAKQVLDGIIRLMGGDLGDESHEELYGDDDRRAAERLCHVLKMYEAWDDGDYREARRIADRIDPALPPDLLPKAITVLGKDWPSAKDDHGNDVSAKALLDEHLKFKRGKNGPADSLFARPDHLLVYIRDEQAKIGRLIQWGEDGRSAYLRAVGLDEFLLKARLALCWLEKAGRTLTLRSDTGGVRSPSKLTISDQKEWFAVLVDHSGSERMKDALLYNKFLQLERGPRDARLQVQLFRVGKSMDKYWRQHALDIDQVITAEGAPVWTKLRGEAIHTHLYISPAIAQSACLQMQAAVDEFECQWLDQATKHSLQKEGALSKIAYEEVTWARLCEVCVLTFLPPALRN